MNVSVTVRDAELLLKLRNGEKRMVYAIANGIRQTALEVQKDIRRHAGEAFTLRDKREFLLRQVAFIGREDFPAPAAGRLQARVSVAQRPGLFLAGYEAGFERRPKVGSRVAVPAGARPTKAATIPAEIYVRRLGLRRGGAGKRKAGSKGPLRGRLGTYLVPGAGIFQRLGAGPSRLLYALARPYRVDPRLRFLATARATIARFFKPELRRQVYETLRFKRGR